MNPDPELARLALEVADLRLQLTELKQFLRLERDETPARKAMSLHIRCSSLDLRHPTAPDDVQGHLSATDEGPSLTLWARATDASIHLTAVESPALHLFDKSGEEAAQVAVETETGRGQMVVFDQGKPRALLKSTDKGGVLSVVHDDGKVRACVISAAEGGEIHVVGAQGKTAVKLASNPEMGGFFTVNNLEGEPRAAVCATKAGGGCHIWRGDGQVGIALLVQPESAAVFVQTGDDHHSRVSLFSHQSGGSIRIYDAKGTAVAELSDELEGGGLRLSDRAGKERLALRQGKDGAFVSLRGEHDEHLILLSAMGGHGSLDLKGQLGHRVLLSAPDNGATLVMMAPKDVPQIILDCTEQTPSLRLVPGAGQWPVASLHAGEHGGVCLLSDREGIRRAGLAANQSGGQVSIFNDLGISRAELACASDGGALRLNWGGTVGVSALAMHEGGVVTVNDANGEAIANLPEREEEE